MYKHTNKRVFVEDLGLMDYAQAWEYQTGLFDAVVQQKVRNRELPEDAIPPSDNYLLFCEHPHVYTLGKSGKKEHLLISETQLADKHAAYYEINRGGDITYHGPGQLVGYPILDLDNFFTDIHKYLRFLEEAIIRTLADFGLKAGRVEGLTGVWIEAESPASARKICAMGVKASRWVTMHGFALNIQPDLTYFNNIVPCGIEDKAVTSMKEELGRAIDTDLVKSRLLAHLASLFNMIPEELKTDLSIKKNSVE